MPDIFLYQGEANPDDVKLRDPSTPASQSITGTGNVSLASAIAGTGTETFSGSGAIAEAYALSGSGTQGITTGSGDVALASALSGSATVTGGVSAGSLRRSFIPFPAPVADDDEDAILLLLEVA